MKFIRYSITTVIVFILLLGCTSIPKDLGRSDVDALTSERGLPVEIKTLNKNEDEFINTLTAEPLTAESAIRIALVNNKRLKATYAELGIAAADVYEGGRIRNPIFHFSTLDTNESGERNLTTFGLIASFTDLITLPARKRYAEGEFSVMKQTVGAEVVATAAEAEAAFYNFVGSKQVFKLRDQIAKAGELSFALAKRYYDAGNLSRRELAIEQATASESRLACLEAEAVAYEKRAELATILGLPVDGSWDAPARLSVPLEQEDDIDHLITLAKESRLDLAAALTRADLLANRLGVTNWTRWLGDLDVGIEHEKETDGAELTGPTIEWEIPIFSQNRDRKLRANAELQIAIAEAQHLVLDIENSVRLAHEATLNTKIRAKEYREKLIPSRIEAVERAQEEENFMLIGIFELIKTKQDEYDAYQGYLEVVRDYWLARTELAKAVGNTLPSSANQGKNHLDVEEYIAPKSSSADHSGHEMNHNMQESDEHSDMQHQDSDKDHSDHNMNHGSDHSENNKQQSDEHSEMQHQDSEMDHSAHEFENASDQSTAHENESNDHSNH